MQCGPALGCCLLGQLGPQRRAGRRHIVQTIPQSLEVQHGAAYQQGQLAAAANIRHQNPGVAHKIGRAVSLERVTDIDQVMRHNCQLVCAGFGRADVHAAVNQGRVHADDLDGLLLRNGQGCGGFT